MWQEIMIAVISGLVGAGGVGAIITFGLSRMYKRVDSLEKNVTDLEDKRISGLEEDLKDHFKTDRSQEYLAEVKNREKWENHFEALFNRFGDKIDRLVDETAEQRAQIKDLRGFVNNTYSSLQNIRKEFMRHGK